MKARIAPNNPLDRAAEAAGEWQSRWAARGK